MTRERGEPFGPYVVYEELGAGGMAQVHRAEQLGIEGFRKVVALKRMLPHVAANTDLVQSFVREARLASFLRHSNVAQTYELGKVGDTYFMAMELIEGRNLRDVLRVCASTHRLMPVSIALHIINQICDALDYAHNLRDHDGQPLGIIHRDVSPSNILVAEGGLVKLIDFGIAKASGAGMQTMSGTIKGKFGYMAPEYIDGRIDARADLFAVGVIAHELLTNQPLFTVREEMATLQRLRSMPIDPPSLRNPSVPPEIDGIVMTALARDPDVRWQHATALRTAMTTVTKRFGLEITHQELAAWLDTLFAVPTGPRDGDASASDGESISISIEQLPPPIDPASSQKLTLLMKGPQPSPLTEAPAGTPARMTAQRSLPEAPVGRSPLVNAEYAAAVAKYERRAALVPTSSFLADEIVPTIVRASAPRLVPESSVHSSPHPAPGPPSRGATEAVTSPGASRGTRRLVSVLLVLFAAGVAGAAVYFLLPLLTT